MEVLDMEERELFISLKSRNKMIFIVIISALLLIGVAMLMKLNIPYHIIFGLIIFACVINGICYIIIKQRLFLKWLKNFQPIINLLLITSGVHYTGGIESIFSYLYLMVIAGESIRGGIKRGWVFAGISVALFSLIVILEARDVIPHIHVCDFFDKNAYKNFAFFMIGCSLVIAFLTASLTGYLSLVVKNIIKLKNEELTTAAQNILSTTKLLETIVRNITDGMITIDAQKNITLANTAIKRLLNISDDKNMINQPLSEFLCEPSLENTIDHAIKKKKSLSCQIEVSQHGNKKGKTLYAKIIPLLDTGDVLSTKAIIIFRDVSEEKSFVTTKANLLSILSHELKTPLTSIKAYSEILLDEKPEEIKKEFLQIIHDEAGKLSSMMENFINFSKIELNVLNLKKSFVDISKIIERILPSSDSIPPTHPIIKLANDKNVSISCEIKDDIPPLFVDYHKIKEAIGYILENAVKFSHKNGKVKIKVEKSQDDEIPTVKIEISDTGIGIDPMSLERIFEPFYQVDISSTRTAGGIGMGLTLAKGIIESHGGEITVESQVNEGSTFTISLPAFKEQ
jgi:two-component system phosphate regulon sensor histidine kinase PhoR